MRCVLYCFSLVLVLVLFFFFKQKTAYEMRISDWSSDVCSSDLFLGPPEEAGVALAAKEVNDANLGIKVEVTYGDSGDPDNKAYATTVPNLLSEGDRKSVV